jgi:cellulose biosynthesis protein BcsQ
VFVTFADQRTIAGKRVEDELREDLGPMVMNSTIARRIAHEYSTQAGYPVLAMDPNSSAAAEYRALAEEMRRRVHT